MADVFTGRTAPRFPSFPKPQFGRPHRVQPASAFSRDPFANEESQFFFDNARGQTPSLINFGDEPGFGTRLDTGAGSGAFNQDTRAETFQKDPGLAFNTRLAESGLPPNLVEFFRKQSGSFLDRFQGELGRQINLFGKSDLNPLDFFRGINFREEFQRLSPSERDPNQGQFNRANRFLF